VLYIRDTIRGKIQPNKVTWLLWAIAPLIAFSAEITQGVGIVALATGISGIVPLFIFTSSFFNKNAEWKITKFDMVCGILSLLGIIMWYVTRIGNVAIIASILADGLAAMPTMVKSYKNPETENDLEFLCGIVNASIALLVIQNWNFENYGFPLYLVLMQIVVVCLIRFKLGEKIRRLY